MHNMPDWLKGLWFDRPCGEDFELQETEHGTPFSRHSRERKRREQDNRTFSDSLDDNIKLMQETYRADISKDMVVRRFMLCGEYEAACVFLNGLSDTSAINDFIIRDGMRAKSPDDTDDICSYAANHIVSVTDIKLTNRFEDAKYAVLDGLAVVFFDKCAKCIIADTRSYPQRSIDTSENEKSVFGPKDSFIENIRTNVSLIRRHTHTDDLVCEMRSCGEDAKTYVCILYREGTASPSLISEVKRRLAAVKVRDVLSTGILTQLCDYAPYSPIPKSLLTERPDRCAAYLNEGHVVLLCDGCPMAGILPVTLASLLAVPEDTYSGHAVSNVMRIVRAIGALVSIIAPGIFIAVVMYHQGFLSSEILNTLIASRKMVFIPIGVELLLLLLVFQLVREAGMRVPGSIGQAIGIIGGLVLGQAVVAANLASSVVLILVALTGLGTFCIPDYSTQLSSVYFRVLFVLAGWTGGFLGLGCALLLFCAYLTGLKSYGVPFLAPFSPKTFTKRMTILRGKITNGNTDKEDYMQ